VRKSYDRKGILEFIRNFLEERGHAPTIGEIQRAIGVSSKSVVDHHLKALEREGYIKRDAQVVRGISVSGFGRPSRSVPLLGTIAAGKPIAVPTEETWHSTALDTIDVPSELLPGERQLYALKVKGTSMIDALVDDGDIVVLEAKDTADNGEMVAAWLSDRNEATLKRLYREKGRIRLQPANPTMSPVYVASDKVEVQGKVVAVLRKVA
jgi:repressor LexA